MFTVLTLFWNTNRCIGVLVFSIERSLGWASAQIKLFKLYTLEFNLILDVPTENDASNRHSNWESGTPPHIIIAFDKAKVEEGVNTIIERDKEYIKTSN